MLDSKDNLFELSDSELVRMSRDGDSAATEAILLRYLTIVRYKASSISLAGYEIDDISQEGFIGLLDAVQSYDEKRQSSFSTYANVCVDNRIKKLISRANAGKASPLKNFVDIEEIDASEKNFSEDPENIYIEKEKLAQLTARIDTVLSSFERKVLFLYLNGQSYDHMADRLSCKRKSVDNAMQRIRRKLKLNF